MFKQNENEVTNITRQKTSLQAFSVDCFSILLNNNNDKDGINSWRYILDLESISSRPTDPWLAQRFWTTFNWFRCPMLIFEDSGCWWLSWPKLSPASQNCHQHISSQTCISDAVTDAASPVGEASSYKNMFDSNFSCVRHAACRTWFICRKIHGILFIQSGRRLNWNWKLPSSRDFLHIMKINFQSINNHFRNEIIFSS